MASLSLKELGTPTNKTQPLGICDHCRGPIADSPYTNKGIPRRFCSVDCRNTANSRAGSPKRSEAAKRRVEQGLWVNPASINRPKPENIGAASRRTRLREVEEERWRNPALDPAARAKLSRPRKHSGALASAMEKLGTGTMADLTQEEADAYRAHSRELRAARRDDANAKARAWYLQRQARLTEEEREAQREKWREGNRRKAERRKNEFKAGDC